MRSLFVVIVALAIAGTAAGAGSRADRAVNWHESWTVNGKPFMAFDVTAINVSSSRWSAQVSVRNTSHFPLTIPARLFQLAIYSTAHPVSCRAYTPLRGGTPVPPPPATLKPGTTWRTTFGGPHGRAPGEPGWARVVFAYFKGGPTAAMREHRFGWITDHTLSLTTGQSTRATASC